MARLCIATAAATAAGFLAGFVAGVGLMAVRLGEDPALNAVGAGATNSRSGNKNPLRCGN
jgi:hypothetical protein